MIATFTDPATGEQHPVLIEPGPLDWVTALVRGERDTFRAARCRGSLSP